MQFYLFKTDKFPGNLVSYRKFGTEETISLDKEEFVNEILVAIETRSS